MALLGTFAAQAVIAIENTRLLNELRQRTTDLSEALEQQTATSEVLKVISSSPGELQSVFQAMLENATRICGAKFSLLLLLEGDAYRYVALHGAPPAFVESCQRRQIISVIRALPWDVRRPPKSPSSLPTSALNLRTPTTRSDFPYSMIRELGPFSLFLCSRITT
jgi:hypothetical protein